MFLVSYCKAMSLLNWLKKSPTNDQTDSQESLDDAQQPTDDTYDDEFEISQVGQPAISDSEDEESSTVVESECADSQALIPKEAHQPILSFPRRAFGKQYRAFCPAWYKQYSWLHYREGRDDVICFYCQKANQQDIPVK